MTTSKEQVRNKILETMAKSGNPAKRTNKGIQWIVEMQDGKRAILKTAAKGNLLVKTRSKSNDSEIIGFDADVSHILADVCLPEGKEILVYLIPKDVVEQAYRRNNREWAEEKPGRASETWVLHFGKNPNAKFYGFNMAEEWKTYLVGRSPVLERVEDTPKLVLDRAKKDIAAAYGVSIRQVRISVDL